MTFNINKLNISSNKATPKREKFEELLRKNNFKGKQELSYKLWRLADSTSTLYVRTYENKIQCVLYGDFDPHVYLSLKYEDIEKRFALGENIFVILLSDNKK